VTFFIGKLLDANVTTSLHNVRTTVEPLLKYPPT